MGDLRMKISVIHKHYFQRSCEQCIMFLFAHAYESNCIFVSHSLRRPRACAVFFQCITDRGCKVYLGTQDMCVDSPYRPFPFGGSAVCVFHR